MQVLIVSEDRSVGEEVRAWVSKNHPGKSVEAVFTTTGADEALRSPWDLALLERCGGEYSPLASRVSTQLNRTKSAVIPFCPQTYQRAKLAAAIRIELDAMAAVRAKRTRPNP